MRFLATLLCLWMLAGTVFSDVYMHNPRGANNRLNEQTATRTNNNRLFDSQNNARGGYNVGDNNNGVASEGSFANSLNPEIVFGTDNDLSQSMQYQMMYYEGSILPIEWTAQHGCGGHEGSDPHKQNCEIILQYACQSELGDPSVTIYNLRDGTNTNTPDAETNIANAANTNPVSGTTVSNNDQNRRGRHESEAYYLECSNRRRNKGLFTADQDMNNREFAVYTRQNNNGGRSGLECPEERDYYPYWSPSPWRDIAVITDHPEIFCDQTSWTLKAGSQNNNMIYKCVDPNAPAGSPSIYPKIVGAINLQTCVGAGGVWKGFSWGLPAPKCIPATKFWSRPNELGNARDNNAQPAAYNWTLPLLDDLINAEGSNVPKIKVFSSTSKDGSSSGTYVKCALRLRYNISTDDYDPWNTTYLQNNNPNAGTYSPVTTNPKIDVGGVVQYLQLAVNTAQFGRTFQDRSHTFYIKKRPDSWADRTIYNLNVRGKRGNIVQTYPAVEYDFIPSRLHLKAATDLVHIQWTGSNSHRNNGDGGDGQAGDAGEGQTGTDRNNFALAAIKPCPATSANPNYCGDMSNNYPLPLDKYQDNIFSHAQCYDARSSTGNALGSTWVDCAVALSTAGYYRSAAAATAAFVGTDTTRQLDTLLNNGPASFVGGVVMDFSQGGYTQQTSYDYLCTRNNNFSNRGQKGTIIIDP